jgi:superfamily II DNA helicase RecQ
MRRVKISLLAVDESHCISQVFSTVLVRIVGLSDES